MEALTGKKETRRRALLNQVDEREDRDPDHVDEVPVKRGDVDEQRVSRAQPTLDVDGIEGQQPEHADGYVRAVEARECEEGAAEQVRLDRESFMHEGRELVGLEAEEGRAQDGRGKQPCLR